MSFSNVHQALTLHLELLLMEEGQGSIPISMQEEKYASAFWAHGLVNQVMISSMISSTEWLLLEDEWRSSYSLNYVLRAIQSLIMTGTIYYTLTVLNNRTDKPYHNEPGYEEMSSEYSKPEGWLILSLFCILMCFCRSYCLQRENKTRDIESCSLWNVRRVSHWKERQSYVYRVDVALMNRMKRSERSSRIISCYGMIFMSTEPQKNSRRMEPSFK